MTAAGARRALTAGRRRRRATLRLAFQIALAVPRTASVTTLHRIRPAGAVTETAPMGRPELWIGAATHTSSA